MILSRVAGGLLLVCALFFMFAGFFATADPAAIEPALPYLPPEGVHFKDQSGKLHWRPFILRRRSGNGGFGDDTRLDERLFPLRFLVHVAAQTGSAGYLRHELHFIGIAGDNPGDSPHFLGTDEYGRDVWSRLLFGGRTTLVISLVAALSASLLAIIFGLSAGFLGGWADGFIMRLVETIMSVPWLYLLLAVRAMIPLRTSPWTAVVVTTGLMAAIGWARPARVLRGAALAARQRSYVTLARASGASRWHLARWHILPDLLPQAITQFTILLSQFIASEVALSYFGLGVDEPLVSWGGMLAAAQSLSLILVYPWLMSPVWAMLPLFFALHLVADCHPFVPPLATPAPSPR
jgi:peptide/nickel transport system permease protein